MLTHRLEQLNENILRELSQMFNREIEFPSNCLATISRVQVSEDRNWAQVWISILPISSRGKVRNILDKKKRFLQKQLNKRLKMKPVPRLRFFTDFTEEQAQTIEQAIDKALQEI